MKLQLRTSWEAYNREVEETNERHRQALLRYVNEERKPVVLPRWKVILGAVACLAAFWGFAIAWIYPWIHRWLVRMGL